MKTTLSPRPLPASATATQPLTNGAPVVGAPVGSAHIEGAPIASTADAYVQAASSASAAPLITPQASSTLAGVALAGVALEGARSLTSGGSDELAHVGLQGADILVHGAPVAPAQASAWWRVTAPAAGSSRSIAPDAAAHALARSLLASDDVTSAWRTLAASGDGFARLVSSTLGMTPSTVYAQVVDAHWERITGEGVDGAGYRSAAGALLESYLRFAAEHGALPTTEDVERMDRFGLEKQGLPALLATGACQSKLAHALDADFSWGRAMGLPPERVAGKSAVFADVELDATSELARTATHAIKKYGLTKALSLDGAAATLRGMRSGGALAISPVVLARAQALAASGDVVAAWRELARHGDDYGDSAAKIIEQRDAPRDFLAAVVDAHWRRIVGSERKAAHFDGVAQRHLDNYLALIARDGGKLPGTEAIERSYRHAVEAEGLPALVAIDALLSRADKSLPDSWLASIGVSEFSWGSVCGMPKERISYASEVFADLELNLLGELAATTLATLRRHFFVLLRPSNATYPLHAVRALFN